ncbi:hypothetical protein [Actinoplanes hulinensis]|uniref:hypothetical protein n=1 Tax=Actinoplanes hulinensis TaxID=1144547 RepID=UPI001C664D8B|nr:hypothetical protein [Actinoplanes hulinensis]
MTDLRCGDLVVLTPEEFVTDLRCGDLVVLTPEEFVTDLRCGFPSRVEVFGG